MRDGRTPCDACEVAGGRRPATGGEKGSEGGAACHQRADGDAVLVQNGVALMMHITPLASGHDVRTPGRALCHDCRPTVFLGPYQRARCSGVTKRGWRSPPREEDKTRHVSII